MKEQSFLAQSCQLLLDPFTKVTVFEKGISLQQKYSNISQKMQKKEQKIHPSLLK